MKANGKLSLRMDDLRIETFQTTDQAQAEGRGTVRANQEDGIFGPNTQDNNTCWGNTCGCHTWADNSCPYDGGCIG